MSGLFLLCSGSNTTPNTNESLLVNPYQLTQYSYNATVVIISANLAISDYLNPDSSTDVPAMVSSPPPPLVINVVRIIFSKSHNLSTIITVIIVITTPFLANYFISFHINYDTA